jgi:hypothetical protein
VRGRFFNAHDAGGAPVVVIVNQTLAQRYFPNENPLGKRIGGLRPDLKWKTIVGVVADAKNDGLKSEPQPETYSPIAQRDGLAQVVLVVRTAADPLSTAALLRREIHTLRRAICSLRLTCLASTPLLLRRNRTIRPLH